MLQEYRRNLIWQAYCESGAIFLEASLGIWKILGI